MTTREYFTAVLNAHVSEELDIVSAEFIARLDAKNAKRKTTETKEKREASSRRGLVLGFLCDHQGEQFTRDTIAEALGITPAQVSAACKVLAADDTITKGKDARRVVYSYPVEE
jgi:CRP-like cAMP-binding protein